MLYINSVFLIYVIKYIGKLTTWNKNEHNAGRLFLPFDRMQAKTPFCLHKHFEEVAKYKLQPPFFGKKYQMVNGKWLNGK